MAKVDTFKLKGQILDARYQVDSVVGEGGFGVVYRATQINFDEPVAIKVLKVPGHLSAKEAENFIDTFRAEGKHLRKLSSEHPAFVRAHDTGVIELDGARAPYLVLEWLDGASLEDDLAARRERGDEGRSLEESMAVVEPIFGALSHAHTQRVAHRDIKPANIFLLRTKTGAAAKLLDFGMAKVMTTTGTQGLHAQTQGGLSGLTPAYAAPEQWDKKMSATGPWTDVYSMALVLVELLTDKPPLDGDDMPSLMNSTLDEEVRPTPSARGVMTDPGIEAVFAKALALHPKDRYRHAAAFWNDLLDAFEKTADGTNHSFSRIVTPDGQLLEPGDQAGDGQPSKRNGKKSKPPASDLGLANTVPLDAATSESVAIGNTIPATNQSVGTSRSTTDAKAKQSTVAAQSQVIGVSQTTAPHATEEKKSFGSLIPWLFAIVVILGIVVWKFQSGSPPEKVVQVQAPKPEPSAFAEAPKPKKKRSKWWEHLPDPNSPEGKTAAVQLPPSRLKWLAARAKAESLEAATKYEEAESALRPALDMACKELGPEDAACVDTLTFLARLMIKLGKFEEAEKLLRQAVELNEKYGEDDDDESFDDARQALVAVLLKQGKTEAAK
ncbi:MAG TPA: protein kinase, partial [Polyangium sp.]|nr:protein kinase [Polyangium sp.]